MKEKTLWEVLEQLGRAVLVILADDVLRFRVAVLCFLGRAYDRRYKRCIKKSIRCREADVLLIEREETLLNEYMERYGER